MTTRFVEISGDRGSNADTYIALLNLVDATRSANATLKPRGIIDI